jgi:RNA recognition motif-containing protein
MLTTLKISNLSPVIRDADLEGMFSLIGNVKEAKIIYDPVSGLSIGIGIVEMSTELEAQDCILHYNGQSVEGQTIFVREDKPHVPDPQKKQLSERLAARNGKKGRK